MRFSPWSYRYADEILNSKLALKKEIEDAIRSIQVPSNGFSRPEMNKEIEKLKRLAHPSLHFERSQHGVSPIHSEKKSLGHCGNFAVGSPDILHRRDSSGLNAYS
jgi:hypothetical protein